MTQFQPSIIVHGGAGPITDDSIPVRLEGCKAAALAGWEILRAGGSAVDAAEAAVVVLEDNPLFNAGEPQISLLPQLLRSGAVR